MTERKLGKLAPRIDQRTLKLARYLHLTQLPPYPEAIDWGEKIASFPMLLNDRLGDCTIAAAGHMEQCWTANAGNPFVPSDADIQQAYQIVSGYDPETGNNDNGAVELDVLKLWRHDGIAGHKIGAFAAVHQGLPNMVKAAVHLFGGLYTGFALPLTAQDQKVWQPMPGGDETLRGSWGGHAVNITGYDAEGLTCITWGATKCMTWSFWLTYCDEAYAIISDDFITGEGKSPDGFDLAQLRADLHAVAT